MLSPVTVMGRRRRYIFYFSSLETRGRCSHSEMSASPVTYCNPKRMEFKSPAPEWFHRVDNGASAGF